MEIAVFAICCSNRYVHSQTPIEQDVLVSGFRLPSVQYTYIIQRKGSQKETSEENK